MELPLKRIQTGLIAALLFLGALFLHEWSFLIAVCLAALISGLEYSRNLLANRLGLRPILFIMVPIGLVIVSYLYPGRYVGEEVGLPFAISGIVIICILAALLYTHSKIHLQETLPTALGMLWIGIPWALTASLFLKLGPIIIFLILGMIWMSDSGAYFIGKNYGKTKLFPSISPNKTVEGAIGGLAFSLIFAALIPLYSDQLTLAQALITACIIVACGITGDLIESRMKRKAEIKDSGTLLPGHGGLLDRFDSFMASIPFIYLFYWLVGLIIL